MPYGEPRLGTKLIYRAYTLGKRDQVIACKHQHRTPEEARVCGGGEAVDHIVRHHEVSVRTGRILRGPKPPNAHYFRLGLTFKCPTCPSWASKVRGEPCPGCVIRAELDAHEDR